MKYFSTNRQSPIVDFREAAIQGQAPDKGLYFPETIPAVQAAVLQNLKQLDEAGIAYEVIRPYVGDTIPAHELRRIVAETLSFPIPLVNVNEHIAALELFHGPTLAFKDVGARFMSRCLGYFLRNETRKVTVLVATSGDTGGAVAHGFYKVPGIEVIILYPSGKVSPVQEKQLTTLGHNIQALEVKGTFDDCQRMVKEAFTDDQVAEKRFLTSANSINVARWLPQQFYYFLALRQWEYEFPPVIAVPSGNFGNICAGLLAMQSGLPVQHFIAACNVNDVVSSYLRGSEWQPRTAVPTLSNAMDVGNPSNFVRILELFGHSISDLKQRLSAATITDEETLLAIQRIYNESGYLADPHGAVGYLALERYLQAHPGLHGIFLETAHPVKFPEAVQRALQKEQEIPAALEQLMQQPKQARAIEPDYEELKGYLLD
ncbi:MAG: threonine synthase [Sphingobacteriales bacterium]|nr:threonine synthase [Sphingobacteriales bacterium]OJW30356.1 MAG: threonine synthase [Sphingobacteriales bacterium 46-32]